MIDIESEYKQVRKRLESERDNYRELLIEEIQNNHPISRNEAEAIVNLKIFLRIQRGGN